MNRKMERMIAKAYKNKKTSKNINPEE